MIIEENHFKNFGIIIVIFARKMCVLSPLNPFF